MTVESWKLWLVPLALWGLYLSWHTGYQSGYADGHDTAWSMSRPSLVLAASDFSNAADGELSTSTADAARK